MKEIDPESLAELNGQNGKPVYIAYRGKVFNVTGSKLWSGGLHMKRHRAAQDLSAEFGEAPHGEEVFERYPQVAILKKKTGPLRPMPAFLSSFIDRYPSLQRHPHPMTVHFPIVFMLSAPFFNFLYLITNVSAFESTAFYLLIGGLLFLPVAMLTGWFTWWLNYLAKPMKPVALKILFSGTLLIAASCALIWRITHPSIMSAQGDASVIYFLLTLSFIPLVSITGWLGATLTFPLEKK
ncbi:MAG TPA: DUF2231 domain-containing protein [Syntrophales bacterium]|nr:DUF2231 domain-containing protein [Syntrophales bacterium]